MKDLAIQKLSALDYLYYRKNGVHINRFGITKVGDNLINEAVYKTAKLIARQLGAELCLRKELSDRQRRKYVRIRVGGYSYYLKGILRK